MVQTDDYATPHFKWSELECRCGCGTRFIEDEALEKLETFRQIIGTPFTPNSSARCPLHNARVGGVPLSFHRSTEVRPSCAFDIPLIEDKHAMIEAAVAAGFRGLGVNYKTFLHIDNRETEARW